MDYAGLVAGLGNPGPTYAGTRHNCGFLFVDWLVQRAQAEGQAEALNGGRFRCELWRLRLPGLRGLWLAAKPQTMMNASGLSVQPLLAWHRIPPQALVVAHDELDIPPGALRFKVGGGNAGHNGLKSICEALGTPDFARLRIGIGRPPASGAVINWVLGRPDTADMAAIRAAMPAAEAVLGAYADKGAAEATRLARQHTVPGAQQDA